MSDPTPDDMHRKKAVALRYDPDAGGAPKMVAKGSGHLAERILEVARQHDIHIHHDPDMIAILAALDLETEIPEQLYKAIAEVLAFVYQINKNAG